jgi:hypothetical protein
MDQWRHTFNKGHLPEEIAAHEWVATVFEPVIRAIPRELRGKLEEAEIFHQVLEHRWFMSQNQDRDVPLAEALNSYVDEILRHRRDEAALLEPITGSITTPVRVSTGPDDWRATV